MVGWQVSFHGLTLWATSNGRKALIRVVSLWWAMKEYLGDSCRSAGNFRVLGAVCTNLQTPPCPCLSNPFKGSEIRLLLCFQRAPGMGLKPPVLPKHKQQNKHGTTDLLGPFYLHTQQHQMLCQWWITASIQRQQKQEMDKKLRAITLGLMHVATDKGKPKPNTSRRGVVWKPVISFAMYLL